MTTQTEPRTPRLAVLIDADNTSAKIVDGLFEEIAKIGEASVRRIYGDFASPRSKGWTEVLARHAIIPQQQFAYGTCQNTTLAIVEERAGSLMVKPPISSSLGFLVSGDARSIRVRHSLGAP